MPLLQNAGDILQGIPFRIQQHQVMEKEIRRLVQEKLIVVILRLDNQLYGLLTYFLRYFIEAFPKKTGNIGLFRTGIPAFLDDLFQTYQKILPVVLLVPAGIGSGMTDRAQGLRLDQQRILVTIYRHTFQ